MIGGIGSWWQLLPRLCLLAGLLFVASLTVSVVGSTRSFAAPATFTVTTTNDSGAGSLRQAIADANSNGNPSDQDVIEFAIAGGGAETITASSDILITQSVFINGYTQNGASVNTALFPDPLNGVIRVEINFNTGNGLKVTAPEITLQGIAAYQPASTGDPFEPIIELNGANNFELVGSYIGADFTGLNSYTMTGINRSGMIEVRNSSGVELGSGIASDRNILGMCGGPCVYSANSTGLVVRGTNIGVGADGLSPFYGDSGADKTGIFLDTGSNNAIIGGQLPGEGNYFYFLTQGALRAQDLSNLSVYGNLFYRNSGVVTDPINNPYFKSGVITIMGVSGATIGASGNGKNRIAGNLNDVIWLRNSPITNNATENIQIIGNLMGYNYNESSPLNNTSKMISLHGDTHEVLIQGNTLHNNTCPIFCPGGHPAITLSDNSQNISMLSNSIFNGSSNMGIDINDNGYNYIDSNDPNDADTGPNNMLNSPGYTNITETAGNTDVTFTIDVPAGNYRIEFFSNSSAVYQGQTYLGFMNITHTGSGLEQFTHTLSGTGHTNLALTATEINPSTPSGFGATSELGRTGNIPPPPPSPISDLSITKRLLNPEDKSLGGVLQYEIKVRNLGPNNFNLANLNSTIGGQNAYFTDVLPPQLQYSGISGPNIACQDYGLGSASFFGPLLANHSDHSIVICAHTGNDILATGQTVTYTLSTTVIDLTNPTFTNHVIASVSSSTNSGYDPDGYILGGIVGAGVDLIDGLRAQPINNYASAYSDAADTSMTGTLLNPHAVEAGGTLQYELNYTNNGPSPINPQVFNGSGINPLVTSLFVSLLPPGASYVSQNNPDLNCMWGGPGSATLVPLFGTHSSYSILMCLYAGSSTSLAAGQSISTVLDVTYNSPNRNFSAYFLGNTTQTDDDLLVIQASVNSGINNNTNDMFDYLLASGINNFLRIGYLSSSPINNTSNTQSNSILSKTGETGVLAVVVGALLCLITIVVLAATRHKK